MLHIIHGVVGAETVNSGFGNQIFDVIHVSFLKFGISVAKALRGVLREIQGLAASHVDHAPIVKIFSFILPAFCRLPGGAEGKVRSAI